MEFKEILKNKIDYVEKLLMEYMGLSLFPPADKL